MKNMSQAELHRIAEAMAAKGPYIPKGYESEDEQHVLLDRQEAGTGRVVTLAYQGERQQYESFKERFWVEVALLCQKRGVLPPGACGSGDSGTEPPEVEEVPF